MPTVVVSAAIFDERGRICCVRQTYGGANWAMPGGGMEPGESPQAALQREIIEETGFAASIDGLIGIYSAPWQDRLVICLNAVVTAREPWEPTGEIPAVGFFARDDLPMPMTAQMRHRILDAIDKRWNVLHVFECPP